MVVTKWYLRHTYLIGDAAGTYEYVGPFVTFIEARDHRATHGPVGSSLTTRIDDPTPCMSPTEHITYLEARA